ncbi:MAG: 50S ribosomal protein L25 [Desulfitobacteriaceae bacterium]|nr:50S ribosomal protein L25 [Desulfitobacteriaceae bacterium]MDD4345554.1 50S ribosomal protein L25 [Desulfitobacteriaceae bacterium]MDD4401217.1 50S ribosomal protein L25 [Desulfitobacteriaceae bacterium]
MEETILNASERTMKPAQCRKAGYTPGVLYGDTLTNTLSVQFETAGLRKVLAGHGSNAKVWVMYDGAKKFGFIKEVQRHPVTARVTHIDVFLVSQDHEVKMQIPITFEGRDSLENLLLQIYKPVIEVFGTPALIPNTAVVDVSEMVPGDTITAKNFNFDKQLIITDSEDEIYAVITTLKESLIEPETEVVDETTTETET